MTLLAITLRLVVVPQGYRSKITTDTSNYRA
jgi:hypothetical protein